MSTWDQYQTAFKAADETTKALLRSSTLTECVETAVAKYELDQSNVRTLVQILTDQTLGIITPEEAAELVRAAGVPAAAVIHSEISTAITTHKPKTTDISQQISDEYNTVSEKSPEISAEPPKTEVASDSLAAELAETEAAFKQLQPIRTMAHDMEAIRSDEEPIHKAVDQETILNGQGNAAKNPGAQWGATEK